MAPTINLMLVDDHAMFRQGLADALEETPGIKVVGQCGTSAEALRTLNETGATMVLLDIGLGAERALDFVANAKQTGFTGSILVVTAGVSSQEAVQLVQAGVAGILHKQHSAEVLRAAIEQVAGGQPYLERRYLAPLFESVGAPERKLTSRDKSVLRLVAQGLTNREIGGQLGITETAVKSALHELFKKLGVRSRAQLVGVALEKFRDQF
jgi:two-component system nitrate/nitrite response regulator NarL